MYKLKSRIRTCHGFGTRSKSSAAKINLKLKCSKILFFSTHMCMKVAWVPHSVRITWDADVPTPCP